MNETVCRNNHEYFMVDGKKGMAKKKKNIPSEFETQCVFREWMTLQHPTILMHCDLSGVRLPIGYAVKIKKLNPDRAWPDIFIAEPRGKYHGLFVELKRSLDDLYTKGGSFRETQHIKEQRHILRILRQKGYKTEFACGFKELQNVVSDYLDRRK